MDLSNNIISGTVKEPTEGNDVSRNRPHNRHRRFLLKQEHKLVYHIRKVLKLIERCDEAEMSDKELGEESFFTLGKKAKSKLAILEGELMKIRRAINDSHIQDDGGVFERPISQKFKFKDDGVCKDYPLLREKIEEFVNCKIEKKLGDIHYRLPNWQDLRDLIATECSNDDTVIDTLIYLLAKSVSDEIVKFVRRVRKEDYAEWEADLCRRYLESSCSSSILISSGLSQDTSITDISCSEPSSCNISQPLEANNTASGIPTTSSDSVTIHVAAASTTTKNTEDEELQRKLEENSAIAEQNWKAIYEKVLSDQTIIESGAVAGKDDLEDVDLTDDDSSESELENSCDDDNNWDEKLLSSILQHCDGDDQSDPESSEVIFCSEENNHRDDYTTGEPAVETEERPVSNCCSGSTSSVSPLRDHNEPAPAKRPRFESSSLTEVEVIEVSSDEEEQDDMERFVVQHDKSKALCDNVVEYSDDEDVICLD